MQFIPFVIVIAVVAIVLFSKKNRAKLEQQTFLSGFEMINDFELIQDWNANDFPVGIGKFMGSLVKYNIYIAIGKKNDKTYVIIKQVMISPLSFDAQYMYLEKSSMENFKKIIANIEKK